MKPDLTPSIDAKMTSFSHLLQIQQFRQAHVYSEAIQHIKNYFFQKLACKKKGVFIQPCSVKPATWLQILSAAAGNSASTVIKYARPAFLCRVYFQQCCTHKWDKGCNTVRWVEGEKKTLIWTQNDYLRLCLLLHEIDLHAFVILLLLSSLFFFFLNSKQESANSTDEGGNTSQRSLASNLQIVHDMLNMHVDYGAVKRWVWITRDTVIMRWDIQPLFCYRSIFRARANEKGTKIKSRPSAKIKKKGGTLTFFHFRLPCGYFHLQFKWIRQYNDFKSLLCQNECYREERRRKRGEK